MQRRAGTDRFRLYKKRKMLPVKPGRACSIEKKSRRVPIVKKIGTLSYLCITDVFLTDHYWEGALTRFPQDGQLMLSPPGTLTTAPQDGQKTDATESSTSCAGTISSSERRASSFWLARIIDIPDQAKNPPIPQNNP